MWIPKSFKISLPCSVTFCRYCLDKIKTHLFDIQRTVHRDIFL